MRFIDFISAFAPPPCTMNTTVQSHLTRWRTKLLKSNEIMQLYYNAAWHSILSITRRITVLGNSRTCNWLRCCLSSLQMHEVQTGNNSRVPGVSTNNKNQNVEIRIKPNIGCNGACLGQSTRKAVRLNVVGFHKKGVLQHSIGFTYRCCHT